jgi:hypothetical protein
MEGATSANTPFSTLNTQKYYTQFLLLSFGRVNSCSDADMQPTPQQKIRILDISRYIKIKFIHK